MTTKTRIIPKDKMTSPIIDGCILIGVNTGDIYIYFKNTCTRIASKKGDTQLGETYLYDRTLQVPFEGMVEITSTT